MINRKVTAEQVAAGLNRYNDALGPLPGRAGRAAAFAVLAAYHDGELLGPAGIRPYLQEITLDADPDTAQYSVLWSSLATDIAANVFTQRMEADTTDVDVDVLRLVLAFGGQAHTKDVGGLLERLGRAGQDVAMTVLGATWIALGRPDGFLVDSPAHAATNQCGGCSDEQLAADLSAAGATAVVHNDRPHTCGRPA